MKKTIALTAIFLFVFTFLPFGVKAASYKSSQTVYVNKGEVVADNFYTAGNTITIDGNIKGDLICAGMSVNINGKIEGDVICAAQNININGEVTGSVRVAGESVNINSKVGKNVNVGGAFVNLGSNAEINGDLILGAGYGEVRGKITRDLVGAGGSITIASEINGNVRLWVDQNAKPNSKQKTKPATPLTIASQTKINGNLIYTSSESASVATGATIKGETKHNLPKSKDLEKKGMAAVYGWLKIVCLFAMLVVGMVLVSLWRDEIKKITEVEKWQDRFWRSLGWGLIVLVLTPFVIIILMITIIGIPLALIIGGLWLIALYVSKILAAIVIGRAIVEKWWKKRKDSLATTMILGVFAIWILCFIPLLGHAVCFLATLWGLGTLWLHFKKA